ncbi:MAG: 6,7-dimethyl-8-ribityllumazine synthase [Gammaproteobacteria bacterium]|nr:6,7-dimethyl-8-ribityllumazine synthase [Gammaproteobacteria bacterium]
MPNLNDQYSIVVSQFNEGITNKLLQGALTRFQELKIPEENIHIFRVPGAIEIPLTTKLLAKTKKYNAIICLGAVIRGETSHYDYVCQQVSAGCMQVMLEYKIPVIFGILTTENEKQAEDRAGGKEGHKGIEAVETAISMLKVISSIADVR